MGSPSYFDFARNAEVSADFDTVTVGELTADQTIPSLGGTVQLSQPVSNPSTSSQSFTIQVEYFKNGSSIDVSETSLSPGESNEFTISESYSISQKNTYTTEVTNKTTGSTVNRGPVDVTWLEISTGSLTANTTTPNIGEAVTLTLGVGNPTANTVGVSVSIREFGISIFSDAATIPPGGSVSFQTTATKSKPSGFIYDALVDFEGTIGETNDVTVTWEDPTAGGIVDDFERPSLNLDYTGDTGAYSISSGWSTSGSNSLLYDSVGLSKSITSSTGVEARPSRGDTIDMDVYILMNGKNQFTNHRHSFSWADGDYSLTWVYDNNRSSTAGEISPEVQLSGPSETISFRATDLDANTVHTSHISIEFGDEIVADVELEGSLSIDDTAGNDTGAFSFSNSVGASNVPSPELRWDNVRTS